MIVLRETTLWRIGRRASLLAYALNRGVIIRDALESFEVIGGLWGLSAENKRSAVCAAMNVLREEMIKTAQLPEGFRFWFEKDHAARIVFVIEEELARAALHRLRLVPMRIAVASVSVFRKSSSRLLVSSTYLMPAFPHPSSDFW